MHDSYLGQLHPSGARQGLAAVVVALLLRWGLSPDKQAELLDVTDIGPFRDGGPLPDDPDVLERAGHLVAIERALQWLYPDDRVMRDHWISFRNEELGGLSPLAVMLRDHKGFETVRALLDSRRNRA
ncbi:DUF2384 domain-containing protein [Thiohalomonas denitrificans]|uniref:Uncharacterized protein n=1 Tax=Thiohalomonas denitrificans TaxID=415747 RepID=A0A1G5QQP5_9GAMM|nr:DUF2384 domain-containing protein [Thiohalomonas denitrificans]SCZ64153.1 Protein of unknown function [Thiohalomonas denitrificans]